MTSDVFKIIGILLIIIGVLIFFAPEIMKILESHKENPLIILKIKKDGFMIGTSPILILILIIVYLALSRAFR